MVAEFAALLDDLDSFGAERWAIVTVPDSLRNMFFEAAIQYEYGNLVAVEQVYDTIVSQLIKNGRPLQSYMEKVC